MPSTLDYYVPRRQRCFDIAHARSLSMTPSSGRAMCQDTCDTVLSGASMLSCPTNEPVMLSNAKHPPAKPLRAAQNPAMDVIRQLRCR